MNFLSAFVCTFLVVCIFIKKRFPPLSLSRRRQYCCWCEDLSLFTSFFWKSKYIKCRAQIKEEENQLIRKRNECWCNSSAVVELKEENWKVLINIMSWKNRGKYISIFLHHWMKFNSIHIFILQKLIFHFSMNSTNTQKKYVIKLR